MTDRSRKGNPALGASTPRRGRPPTPGLRDALLASGLASMHERGYQATGVAEIVEGAGAPKGAFYAHFASKDEFAIAVVDRFADAMYEALRARLKDTAEPSPLARLRGYFEGRLAHHRKAGCVRGCLLGNFALELSDQSDPIRERVRAHLEGFARELAATIAQAQTAGEVRRDHAPAKLAHLLVRGWEGALIAMRAQRSVGPLRDFVDVMIDEFLAAPK